MPDLFKTFIPSSGVPAGLTLSSNGQLSVAVQDNASVVFLNIPFVNIELTGFFFYCHVEDSQDPADSESAVFLIPTVPVDLP